MESHETYYKSIQDFITFMHVFMTLFHYNFQYYITVILPCSNARNYFNFLGLLIYSVFFNSINMKHTLLPLILLMYFLNIHLNVIPFFFVVYQVDVSSISSDTCLVETSNISSTNCHFLQMSLGHSTEIHAIPEVVWKMEICILWDVMLCSLVKVWTCQTI